MPTYDYKCSRCGEQFEVVQSMKDPHLTKCEKCGNESLVRLIGGGGVIFKGSGFYQTDYKNSGENKGSVSSTPDKKADSKPAAEKPSQSTPPKKD